MKILTKLFVWPLLLILISIACNVLTPESTPKSPSPTSTPLQISPTPELTPTGLPSFVLVTPSSPVVDTTTLETLRDTIIPLSDPIDIARRLMGIVDIPRTLPPPESFFQVGDQMDFWITNNDTAQQRSFSATLRDVTPHAYFWIEDDVIFDPDDVRALITTFENEIYPTNRAFFGSEWNPGVDGDPHIYILFASGIGSGVAGYYSSGDEYPPQVQPGSNGHEMFVLSADNLDLGDQFTFSVLAHEFQHMIHWNQDRNETSWINEGFSELAQLLNGYSIGYTPGAYLFNPDHQLTDWPNSPGRGAYYGASFLFLNYFLDRFGETTTQALVADSANGLVSIDNVLSDLGATDPITAQGIRADDVVMDWVLANYIVDSSVLDGRYDYSNYTLPLEVFPTETIRNCSPESQIRNVHQYGVDYIRIRCSGQTTLQFEGDVQTGLLPASAYSGKFSFWSNKGDQSDMTLTRTFDFTDHSGPLTFTFWTWYNIETDWDYVYLLASTDGQNWEFLQPPSVTDTNPAGNNYGWGYTDLSGGDSTWVQESVDISQFAGQQVQLRFEYITDTAVNGEGMLIDDISIPEINYFSDFEDGDGGWEANGFVRVNNILPQTFRLALISYGDSIQVQFISLDLFNRASIPLDFDTVDEYILVVLGTTRFTRELANYTFSYIP